MDIEKAREFVRGNHRAVMHTWHADGRPQLSPVTVGVDEAGHIIVSTRETAAKVRNLRRDPRAIVCVMNDAFYGAWILVEGTSPTRGSRWWTTTGRSAGSIPTGTTTGRR